MDLSWSYEQVVERFGEPESVYGGVSYWSEPFLSLRLGGEGEITAISSDSLELRGSTVACGTRIESWQARLGEHEGSESRVRP